MSRWIETAALEIKNRFAPRGRAPGQLMIMFAFGIVSMICFSTLSLVLSGVRTVM